MSPKPDDVELKSCELEGCDAKVPWLAHRDSRNSYDRKRFCSRACAVTHGRWHQPKPITEKECKECGTTMYRREGERSSHFTQKMFCSDPCRNKGRQKSHTEAWARRKGNFATDRRQVVAQAQARQDATPPAFGGERGIWRPAGFPTTPHIPERIRKWNEENAA